jgi:hypothetical protein
VLLHEFGEDFVLALEFVLEGGNLTVFGVEFGLAAFAGIVKGGGAVLEELLLPEVEEVNGEVVFLADVGNGLLLQEMESKESDLLVRGKVTALTRHECSSARVLPLIPAKANSYSG